MKKREKLSGIELSTICRQLKMESSDGKRYSTDCANIKGLLRIIQSIPSPKVKTRRKFETKTKDKSLHSGRLIEIATSRSAGLAMTVQERHIADGNLKRETRNEKQIKW